MAAERFEDAGLTRALEEVEEALRTERRALEAISSQSARLRARLERLRAEKKDLLGEVELLRREQAQSGPQPPESLRLFKSWRHGLSWGRPLLEAMPLLVSAGSFMLFTQARFEARPLLLALGASFLLLRLWDSIWE